MCIIMVMYQMVPDVPVLLLSNRDEYHNRSTQNPGLLARTPAVWGGRDDQAGGTWLGVNEYGLVVGLTNRRMNEEQANVPDRRSRGLLCLDALHYGRVSDVATFLTKEPPNRYNAFNLLVLNADSALWVAYDGEAKVCSLQPGIHILANRNLNDTEHGRSCRASQLLQMAELSGVSSLSDVNRLVSRLQSVCQDHEAGMADEEMICMHRDDKNYGTVSSTVLAISTQRSKSIYRYASGHPCESAYQDVSDLIIRETTDWTIPV